MDEILSGGFAALGLTLTPEALARFHTYYDYLEEQNRLMNLTAIQGPGEVSTLHFLDCVALLRYASFAGARVIDVGSGAGFPGLPVKIACPETELTLLDSQKKRVDFLERTCALLGFEDVCCVYARAEETPPEFREAFDYALSRAVARLSLLCELCLPFVRVGGSFLAMKGPDCEAEVGEAASACAQLGGRVKAVHRYELFGSDAAHSVVEIEKIRPTPSQFPRRWARILKAPL